MEDRNRTIINAMQSQAGGLIACPAPEEILDYAYDVYRNSGAVRAEKERHIFSCERCLGELSEIQKDLLHIEKTSPAGERKPVSSFHLQGGFLAGVRNFLFFRPGPAFRSAHPAVIHSALAVIGSNYVLLELTGDETDLRLYVEKGTKNDDKIRISLYINESLSDKRFLYDRLDWNLKNFSPGHYRLSLEDKTVLKFSIVE